MSDHVTCETCGQPVNHVGVARAARALNLSDRRVQQIIAEGRLPNAWKILATGGEPAPWRIPLADLAAYAEAKGTPFQPLVRRTS
jgi:hypothetical protein